jgi:uncharacterized protein YbbK (DUF523 family)
MRLVSACLVGINCRYDASNAYNEKIFELFKKGELLPICPEVLAGLGIPRERIELTGDGVDVLKGRAKAITRSGKDVTFDLIEGAKKVLKIAKVLGIKQAVLKTKSPSCGVGLLLNGTFTGRHVKRDGVLAALLKKNGIQVMTEREYEVPKLR